MNAAQVQLVQQSFEKVSPIANQVAWLFYGRLFEIDPSLRLLFRSDITSQGRKLMDMIALAVTSLDRLEQVLPTL